MNIKVGSLIIFILLTITSICHGQSNYQFGALPSINLNKKLPNELKLNFKLESRQQFKQGFFNESKSFEYDYILTDFTFLVAKKIAYNKSLAIGYLFRMSENEIIQRSIQQFIFTKKYSGFKLSHRISSDQTFQQKAKIEYRLRYRLSSEIALNGESVDPKEFYLKVNNEYLNSIQNGDYDLEIRFTPFLGYNFSTSQKLELGLDYRINSFIDGYTLNRYWIGINWYLSI